MGEWGVNFYFVVLQEFGQGFGDFYLVSFVIGKENNVNSISMFKYLKFVECYFIIF